MQCKLSFDRRKHSFQVRRVLVNRAEQVWISWPRGEDVLYRDSPGQPPYLSRIRRRSKEGGSEYARDSWRTAGRRWWWEAFVERQMKRDGRMQGWWKC